MLFRHIPSIVVLSLCMLFSVNIARAQLQGPHVFAPVRGQYGMVVSADRIASQVGVDILRKGGNAVDAAIAVGLALAVTWPEAGNIGGGGFMMIHTADGINTAVDYREQAPAGSHRDMYLDEQGRVIPDLSTRGYRAAAVPGTIAGFEYALKHYGTMDWTDLVDPAIEIAAKGFRLSYSHYDILRKFSFKLKQFPETRTIFLKDTLSYGEGELLVQKDLAATLTRLKMHGPREFYEGKTAQLIAEDMSIHNGLITAEDLRSYRAVEREPVSGSYRGYKVVSMPPPSSGGPILLLMLNILEHYDLTGLGHNSSATYHLLIEAMRRAFADRAENFGDPDFVKTPIQKLVSKAYAAELQKTISAEYASASRDIKAGQVNHFESSETTHFTVIDRYGNAVSNTYTLNSVFGSGVVVKDAGILLNNIMDDFTVKPGEPNQFGLIQGEANAIAPYKRPLSAMTPTMVFRNDSLYFVIGSPGGPTIINQMLQVIINIVDHGMNLQQAVNAPRIHHQWRPDTVMYEKYGLSRDVIEALQSKGHIVQLKGYPYMGDVAGIMIEPGTGILLGAADPRNPNATASGY